MKTSHKRRINRSRTPSDPALPRGLRRSSRLAAKRAETTNSQAVVLPCADPFLAIGRRGNKCWCAWRAVPSVSLDGLTLIDGAVPGKRKLYIDQEGFVAVRHKYASESWIERLPVETGPWHTSKGRHSPLRIGEGRCTVLLRKALQSPTLVAIADRMISQSDGNTWYLVVWSPCMMQESCLHRWRDTRSRPVVMTRLQHGRSIVQLAPSWMSLHDFEPHEFALLRYFYERVREGTLAIDEGRCAKLASLNLLQAERAASVTLETTGRGWEQGASSQASGSTNRLSASAS